MISPYIKNTKVTNPYGYQGHRGIDLSAAWGIGDLTIVSVANGSIVHAGWNNGGYGNCVVIKDNQDVYWIYAHLSKVLVTAPGYINVGQTLGIEGNTGNSKGTHLHLEARQGGWDRDNKSLNVAAMLGIPNIEGTIFSGSNTAEALNPAPAPTQNKNLNFTYKYDKKILELQKILNRKGAALEEDGIFGEKTLSQLRKYTIEYNDKGELTKWVQERLSQIGFNSGFADGFAELPTMIAIEKFQISNKLGTVKRKGFTYLAGDDWFHLCK